MMFKSSWNPLAVAIWKVWSFKRTYLQNPVWAGIYLAAQISTFVPYYKITILF